MTYTLVKILPVLLIFASSSLTVRSQPNPTECLNQCAANYTFDERPSPCCGCCGPTQTCNQIPEFSVCCNANQEFCGCLSFRAFCAGSIFNSSIPTNAFGTCYDPTKGFCTYEPSPNLWIVCPTGYTSCESASFFSCCAPGTTCTTNMSDLTPNCAVTPGTSATTGATTTGSTTGTGPIPCGTGFCYFAGDKCCGGQCYNPNTYTCFNNRLCPAGTQSCGSACYNPTQYCCSNGQLRPAGSCGGTTGTTGTGTTGTTGTSTTGTTTGPIPCGSGFCYFAGDKCCGGQCYNPKTYTCFNNRLCPAGTQLCGTACYNPAQYKCVNGKLQPA